MVITYSTPRLFFSQDGRWLFQLLCDHLRVWDVDKQKCISEVSGAFLGVSYDETILLTTGKNDQLFVWNLLTGEALNTEHVNHELFPRHQRVLLNAGTRSVTINDIFGNERVQEISLVDQVEEYAGIVRAPNAPFASVVVGWDIAGHEGSMGLCIDLDKGERLPGCFRIDGSTQRALSFSAEQKTLTVIYVHDEVVVYDLLTGEQISKVRIAGCYAAHSPTERSILAVTMVDSPAFCLYDVDNQRGVRAIGVSQKANETTFHPDGRKVACLYREGQFGIWDTHNGRLLWEGG